MTVCDIKRSSIGNAIERTKDMSKALYIKTIFLCLTLFLFSANAVYAEELRIVFSNCNARPYAFIEDNQLVGGLIKDLMDELTGRLDLHPTYVNIPKKRNEAYLLSGAAHVIAFTNPNWLENSDKFNWSIPLFQEESRFVVSVKNPIQIKMLNDLDGRRMGTINGYRYCSQLTEKFESQKVLRDDVDSLEQNFMRLDLGRIDCLISAQTQVMFYLNNHTEQKFVIAEKVESTNTIHAAFTKNVPVSIERINNEIKKMKDNGKITEIFKKYNIPANANISSSISF